MQGLGAGQGAQASTGLPPQFAERTRSCPCYKDSRKTSETTGELSYLPFTSGHLRREG